MDQGKTILDAREKPKNQSGSLSEAFFGWLMDDKSQQKNSKEQEKSKVCSSKKLGSDADWVESVVYFR